MPEEEIETLDSQESSGDYSQQPSNNKLSLNNIRKPIRRSLKGTAGNILQNSGQKIQNLGKKVQTTGQAVNTLGKGAKTLGKGAKVAGKGVKAAGKGVKVGTQALGTALSAIPVVGGALGAGVKLAGTATNAAAQAGGKAAELGGQALDKAGDIADKVAGKIKSAGGKIEEKGKAVQQKGEKLSEKEKPKSIKDTNKNFVKIVKVIVGIFSFIIFNFPLFFLLFLLIGNGIANVEDSSYNWYADYETGEFYTENSVGNIQKAIINELDKPVPLKDGVEPSFTGEYAYGISNGYRHNGIDLNKETIGALPGDNVFTIYSGVVEDVGYDDSSTEPGYYIRIKHEVTYGDNKNSIIYSYYKGLNEESVLLSKGDEVFKEQKLGTLDSKGSLHFEIEKQDGESLNPTNIYIPFANAVIANTVTGNEVIDKIITMITTSNVLDDRMKDNVHIASILGNIQAESGFNVASSQAGVPKEQVNENTPLAIGLVQWDYERKENLIYYSRAEGSTWYDIDIQLRFFEGELTRDNRSSLSDNIQKYTSYQLGNGFDKWLNETNPETAATIYTDSFERCDPEYCHYEKRKFSARCWYNLLQNGQNSADYCMTHES